MKKSHIVNYQAQPKSLSIIIPAYNEEAGIKACLDAIAAQTIRPDEVIVVDNNSTDATAELVREYGFVRLIRERRQGLYYARNAGMDAARGDILARIDADTIIDRTWVAAIKQAFEDRRVQALSGPVGYHDMPFRESVRRLEDGCLRMARAGKYKFLMGPNMAMTRQAWQLIHRELCNQPFLFEDIDIAIHLRQHGVVASYSSKMAAMVSARRLGDKPADFLRYIGGHTRTWRYHGLQPTSGVHFAQGVFTMTYFGIKPLHMSYDADLRRLSFSKLKRPSEARPDPMAVT